MLVRELERLADLHAAGTLTDEEYLQAKHHALYGPYPADSNRSGQPQLHGIREGTWISLLHLSPLAGFLFLPGLGLVLPVAMWLMSRDQSPVAERHGRIVVNWVISSLIMTALAGLLVSVGIGIPLLMIIFVLDVVFPIMGFVKARRGEDWTYPLSIEFLRVNSQAPRHFEAASLAS